MKKGRGTADGLPLSFGHSFTHVPDRTDVRLGFSACYGNLATVDLDTEQLLDIRHRRDTAGRIGQTNHDVETRLSSHALLIASRSRGVEVEAVSVVIFSLKDD